MKRNKKRKIFADNNRVMKSSKGKTKYKVELTKNKWKKNWAMETSVATILRKRNNWNEQLLI